MDSVAGPVEPLAHPADSPNLKVVKELFRAFLDEGVDATMQKLLRHSHEGTEFRLYSAAGRVLRGPGELREFFDQQAAEGTELSLRLGGFKERGDEVVVSGSVRLVRPTGGFAESQVCWFCRFREDGVLDSAHWGPRTAG
jgi:ketosteroid isomerase-like protein